jgi:large subunit ribosomal protein L9
MQLLLQRSIANLGKAGDLVEVSSGYARNYLLPHGLALVPTKGNLKRVEELRAIARKEEFKLLQELQARAQTIDGLEVNVTARNNELGHLFGSVGPVEVSAALKEIDFDVPELNISLEPHLKEIGEYEVQVKFAEEALAQIKLTVLPETPLSEEALSLRQAEQQTDDSAEEPQSDEPNEG